MVVHGVWGLALGRLPGARVKRPVHEVNDAMDRAIDSDHVVSASQAGRGGMMSPGMGGRGGRGMMGGRGGGMMGGGRGLGAGRRGQGIQIGMPMARMGGREYTDLDAPENQRSVLDYGDL